MVNQAIAVVSEESKNNLSAFPSLPSPFRPFPLPFDATKNSSGGIPVPAPVVRLHVHLLRAGGAAVRGAGALGSRQPRERTPQGKKKIYIMGNLTNLTQRVEDSTCGQLLCLPTTRKPFDASAWLRSSALRSRGRPISLGNWLR